MLKEEEVTFQKQRTRLDRRDLSWEVAILSELEGTLLLIIQAWESQTKVE